MRLFRHGGLPPEARGGLRLEPGERAITYGVTQDGAYVVATDRALHLPTGPRVGWERVEHAAWQGGWLHVRETAELGEQAREHHVRLAEPRALPEAVRERVQASIVVNQYARLDAERGVRIVGRRRPGDDVVVWTLVFDAGLDPRDPGLRAHAEQVLEDVRRQTGM